MQQIPVKLQGRKLYIGESPQLIVDIDTQKNYLVVSGKTLPYQKEVRLSPDLLQGKRPEVFRAAVNFYYQQASKVAEGIKFAEAYRNRANTTIREKK